MNVNTVTNLAQPRPRRKRLRLKSIIGYLFIAPAVLFLFVITAYALVYTISMSFSDYSFRTKSLMFVGLQNYITVFQQDTFWHSVRVTATFTLAAVVLHVLIGGGFALLLNERWFSSIFRDTMRGILILPWLFSFAASALVWGLLLHPFGILSYLAMELGLAAEPVEFLGSEQLALPSLVAVNIWKTFPFYMIMILGGLQSIPQDLYEAAKVDGAGRLQRFWNVTLPLLRPVLVAITSIDLITTVGHYDLAKTLTEGGPFRSTQLLAYHVWLTGFRDANFGYGAAVSVVLLVGTTIATVIYLRIFAPQEAIYGDETTTGI